MLKLPLLQTAGACIFLTKQSNWNISQWLGTWTCEQPPTDRINRSRFMILLLFSALFHICCIESINITQHYILLLYFGSINAVQQSSILNVWDTFLTKENTITEGRGAKPHATRKFKNFVINNRRLSYRMCRYVYPYVTLRMD